MKPIAILLLALAGCTTPAPPASSPCPDLPELAQAATLADLEAHHLAVVRLYGACRAAKSPPKLEK
ncbi:hypothetical protein [Noviherbaspirillum suwonense]|jgi:hypothetical protein|uniref:Lipoprotein n=1 Tax=Noviherbaspirillum suwonense TaxID=1224511 RepID=A0ABY1QIR9_9BURK|nr:hypothetical protein [Noviherbaspirillum suwonense]SMP72031.1 hypothetical protein SAMN06295970_117115 [Noviherbaspirillum suwonense]